MSGIFQGQLGMERNVILGSGGCARKRTEVYVRAEVSGRMSNAPIILEIYLTTIFILYNMMRIESDLVSEGASFE